MTMKNLGHGESDVQIDKLDIDIEKVVNAVDKCTGEVARLHLKKIPPPVVNNEIVGSPPTVINKIESPEVKVPVNIQFNFEALKKCLFICTGIVSFVLFFSIIFGEVFLEWILWGANNLLLSL